METQSRWKSPVAWAGVATVIFMVVRDWVGFEIPNWDSIVTTLIAAFVAFGIFNNPENKKKY